MGTQRSTFIGLFTVWLCFILLWVGWASGNAWAQSADVCGPAPAVKAALDQLPEQTPALTDWQFHEQHAAALQALLRQYPDDVFVQRAYINSMCSRSDKDKVIAEYKARYERNPDNPQLAYLYGLTLVGRQSPEAIKLFSAALKENPKFPVAASGACDHLQLTGILEQGAKRRAPQGLPRRMPRLAGRLRAADPHGRQGPSAPLCRPVAHPAREAAATPMPSAPTGRSGRSSSRRIRRLTMTRCGGRWARTSNASASLNSRTSASGTRRSEDGYKLVNDQKQSDWAQEQAQTRFPRPWELAAMTKWWKDHHWPGEDAPPDKKRAFYSDLLQQSAQWVKERPNTIFIWYYRLDAMEELDDVPAADVKAAVDQTLKVAMSNAGPDGPGSNVYFNVAEVLSKKHLEPERVVELAQKGLAQNGNRVQGADQRSLRHQGRTRQQQVLSGFLASSDCWNSRWTATCN